MIKAIIFSLIATFSLFLSFDWSENNIIKYRGGEIIRESLIMDYSNIESGNNFIMSTNGSNSWLRTYKIEVGSDYVLSSAYINLKSESTNSFAVLTIRDNRTDVIIKKGLFYESGNMDMVNVFNKEVYILLEIFGLDVKVYSFGLKRILEEIIRPQDITLSPDICFYGQDDLIIDFKLRVPSTLDIIIFDFNGIIIDYALKDKLISEGDYSLKWKPLESSAANLPSGTYFIYFFAQSVDNKSIELTKEFLFVNY